MPRSMPLKHSLWKALEKCQSKYDSLLFSPTSNLLGTYGALRDERVRRNSRTHVSTGVCL